MAEKEKKERAKRATMGFQILDVHTNSDGTRQYTEITKERFESLSAAERFIKKNAAQFAAKVLMIAHLKKEIKVTTETKSVAKLQEVK